MRTVVRDLVLLGVMCLVLYCTGVDTHGVTNWQEAQRVVVAREMQAGWRAGEDGALLVPRHNGMAYLAKPPVIYWATLAIAWCRGGTVELYDLRLAVGLGGLIGVLGTYLVARSVLCPIGRRARDEGTHAVAARWASVFLATGVLYFRSARIGELDILLVPGVVGAVGCIWQAWRAHLERVQRGAGADWFGMGARWGWVVLAAVCASVAVMTKGPPALMVIALAGYGAVAWRAAALGDQVRGERWGLVAGALAFGAVAAARMTGAGDALGVLMLAAMGALVGGGVVRLARRDALREAWLGLAATHPVVVLGAPVLAFWWWGREVSSRIGMELAVALAKEQAENDLNIFMAASPVKNLEALAYGCGVGSVLMLVGAAWWVRYRPGVRRSRAAGIVVPVAWVVLSFCALSMFGKGVARYLTPVWPGVAILAGAWLVRAREAGEDARRITAWRAGPVVLGAICVVLGVAQAWWYGWGREVFEAERTPRAMVETLQERLGVEEGAIGEGGRYASFEFYTPALDYYAGAYVQPVVTAQMGDSIAGSRAWTVEELAADVRSHGARYVFVRAWSLDRSLGTPVERLRGAGLRVAEVQGISAFVIDHGRAGVSVVRVE
jgi:4-amino-4-deoxy-L-arabinose transferase-like glycosyltransferase